MDSLIFSKIAESLRQYRRAELKDFDEIGDNPVDLLYVDPLPDNAILNTVLSANTTFIVGRKGTGKSTVFAKAQSEIRKQKDLISIYIDVKSLYEIISSSQVPVNSIGEAQITRDVLQAHFLRKSFLATVLSELIKEVKDSVGKMSLWDRWLGKKKEYQEVIDSLTDLSDKVKISKLSDEEIPILRFISEKMKDKNAFIHKEKGSMKFGARATSVPSSTFEAVFEDSDESLKDSEVYHEYSDAILRTFPFSDIIDDIKNLLDEAGMKRLIIFYDDFSELNYLNQKLFVDVILAPLNNSSNERIKLKIAGYPGRIYYGKIDPSKVDTIFLDFYSLYKSPEFQTTESSAMDYTRRLLERRFEAFGTTPASYLDSSTSYAEYIQLFFQTTFNVPRLMGYILHYCYLDRVSKGQKITLSSIKLAAQKYYENVILQYFERANRFALEPFNQKLDRHIQHLLLKRLVIEAKDVRGRILSGDVGGNYFEGLSNPPVSHFAISPGIEGILSSLELNFLVTKYHEMRDKDGKDVSIYAMFYGLCEAERFLWGYPKNIKDYRKYFIQRCFNYNSAINDFLVKNQTIRCEECGACFPVDKRESFVLFNWNCPECKEGKCEVINLGDDFLEEVQTLKDEIMLDKIELDILNILQDENKAMKASEISALLDLTYQLVGKRTTKLQQMGLVNKSEVDNSVRSAITSKAKEIYFSEE